MSYLRTLAARAAGGSPELSPTTQPARGFSSAQTLSAQPTPERKLSLESDSPSARPRSLDLPQPQQPATQPPKHERDPARAPAPSATSTHSVQAEREQALPAMPSVLHALDTALRWVSEPASTGSASAQVLDQAKPSSQSLQPRVASPLALAQPRVETQARGDRVAAPTSPVIEIGTIDVHVHSPAPAPRPAAAAPGEPARLSRGFATGLGLRQS